jgi:nucleotide-binding universal stress UspA family protein
MYKSILVPLDGSATSDRGLRAAIDLAAALKAKLVLMHVVDDFALLVEMSSSLNYQAMHHDLREYGHKILDQGRRVAAESGVKAELHLREATQVRASDLIVEEAKKHGCDLIAMGTHGRRGFSRLALGSNAEGVMRNSPVPVLLVRHEDQKA